MMSGGRISVHVRAVLGAAALAAASLAASVAALPDPAAAVGPGPAVSVAGQAVDMAGDLGAQARVIGRTWLGQRFGLKAPDERRDLSRRQLGFSVDLPRLVTWLEQARDSSSPMRRLHARVRPGQALRLPMPANLDAERTLEVLIELKDHLDRPARSARVDTERGQVVAHEDGRQLDVWATVDAIDEALQRGSPSVDLVVRVTPAERTIEALGELRMSAVLGSFGTRYDRSERARDRTHNVRLGSQKIDGTILMPGEELDFNRLVGERTRARGFRMAPVIAQGVLDRGVGGGMCQVAGTLHAAAFFAALPILERHPHSRPSGYIKLGLDAMVAYPNLGLRFRNDRPFPIVIGMRLEHGEVRATIRGAESGQQVTFVRRVDGTTPFPERVREDPALPSGVRVLAQRGVPGFQITRWRIVRDVTQNQAVRTRMTDRYPPTTQIWRLGTGGPAPEGYEPPPDDSHPEYTADAYLQMTRGAGVEGTLEQRRAGRTGTPGWTATMVQPAE